MVDLVVRSCGTVTGGRTGVVRTTWLRGRTVTGETPQGRFLTREN